MKPKREPLCYDPLCETPNPKVQGPSKEAIEAAENCYNKLTTAQLAGATKIEQLQIIQAAIDKGLEIPKKQIAVLERMLSEKDMEREPQSEPS